MLNNHFEALFAYPSDSKLLNLINIDQFGNSARQGPTYYCPAANGDVHDIAVSKKSFSTHIRTTIRSRTP
jgi:hypothetical protein